ncbi:MAG TPA: hypothetical protein PLF40_21750 [Kofleriaceae bacterium]|nr:hypothetical protein [Kofleriaceae bacterium]
MATKTYNKTNVAIALSMAAAIASTAGACGGDDTGALGDVKSLVFLQRPKHNSGMGDIFQYTSYNPGARLVKLEPPTADGKLTVLCCDKLSPEFAKMDISGYDLSFDATKVVFAGKLNEGSRYGLFMLTLADGKVEQLATDPGRDYVSPIFLPGDKIMFTTNAVVEPGAPQHQDEYERGTTLQLGTINADGTGEVLGPRNLSHRVFPTLTSDGRVMTTQWDHLGPQNAGHLVFVNQDMTAVREAFGKEGTGLTNSYLKATEVSPGRFVAIGTSRNRTIQAGALLDIRLGKVSTADGDVVANSEMSEANASVKLLTANVPLDRTPSSPTVGRYYDAYPLNAGEDLNLLVSWADGTVESGSLEAAGLSANFGVYLYDTKTQTRKPIWDDADYWDIFARPLRARSAPPVIEPSAANGIDNNAALIGSMNAYQSSLDKFAPGSLYGVRVMEGFSSEEGPRKFGTTMFEGHANLGVAPLQADGSWLATVPPNIPLHLQMVDKFGMSVRNEPVWFSGARGESRVCGGCHESRSATTVINPGITMAAAVGPSAMYAAVPRGQRVSNDFSRDKVMGVPWDKSIQPILDAKCVSCHDGSASAANPSYTITDPVTATSVTWRFDLRGQAVTVGVGDLMITGYTASYISLAGLDMEAVDKAEVMVTGDYKTYMNPTDAKGSLAIKLLNPVQQFPTQNANVRAFATTPHAQGAGFTDLTADEYYRLVLAADMGMNFYSRENNPGASN